MRITMEVDLLLRIWEAIADGETEGLQTELYTTYKEILKHE